MLGAVLQARLGEMKAALGERGVAITPRRERLLDVLLASDRHPSVSEIHEGVKRYYPGTSLATIYNTIELLKETGQVLEIEFSGASNRYDGRIPKSHPHLVCEVCEKVEDLDIGELKDPFEDISNSTGYRICAAELTITACVRIVGPSLQFPLRRRTQRRRRKRGDVYLTLV